MSNFCCGKHEEQLGLEVWRCDCLQKTPEWSSTVTGKAWTYLGNMNLINQWISINLVLSRCWPIGRYWPILVNHVFIKTQFWKKNRDLQQKKQLWTSGGMTSNKINGETQLTVQRSKTCCSHALTDYIYIYIAYWLHLQKWPLRASPHHSAPGRVVRFFQMAQSTTSNGRSGRTSRAWFKGGNSLDAACSLNMPCQVVPTSNFRSQTAKCPPDWPAQLRTAAAGPTPESHGEP